mmetsp:Transcript_17956/g.54916  ORF Transcript_17956/g.54916 Transcript_17956/m.54916 type:complete len:303 (+) Transcript_17956:164-1072(+)
MGDLGGHLDLGELLAHLVDGLLVGLLVARGLEDGGAGHEHVNAGLGDLLDVVDLHAAIDLEADVVARLVDHLASLLRLLHGGRDEGLAAEARVHGHEEDDVELVHDVLAVVKGGARVDHEAGLAALGLDELEGAVDVARRLRVEGDVGGAGVGEVLNNAVHRGHHQVHVDGGGHAVVAQGLAHHGADGKVRDVVVVHHVEVHHIGAGGEHVVDLLAELGKVSGEDGRRDEVLVGLKHVALGHHVLLGGHAHLAARGAARRREGGGAAGEQRNDGGTHHEHGVGEEKREVEVGVSAATGRERA